MFEGDQVTDVRDLLIVTENVLTVLAYEEADGWVSVARFNNTTKFSEAVAAIIDDLEQRIDELTEFSPSSEFSARGPE